MAHGLSGRACVDGRNNYLLRVKWLDGLGKITLFNFEDVRIWEGKLQEEDNSEMSRMLKMNLTDYKAEITRALLETSTELYQCSIHDSLLTIKKVTSEEIAYTIASVRLHESEIHKSLPQFMSFVADTLAYNASELIKKDEEIKQLSRERSMLMERCKGYLKAVEEQGPLLYAQFAEAFNSLKRRLSEGGQLEPSTSIDGVVDQDEDSSDALQNENEDSYQGTTDIDTDGEAS